jgi:glutaredoxin
LSVLHTVIVYTADGCPHCQLLLADFDRRGVEYHEVNVSRDPRAIEQVRAVSWEDRLPVVADHERVSIGFRGRSSTFSELGIDTNP